MDNAPRAYNLVELTAGPWRGIVHRTEIMTDAEAQRRNATMSGVVMRWETRDTRDDLNEYEWNRLRQQ